ncbi:aminotransferase class IV [Flavobacterium aciduliphilum]|uniref:branched-chain-amino-acid transaminase n=1 Tax=Flavobacterium aciduliphilum TaxID=1101402 RepID=A0A328Z0L8_9FLAO|nr:aminotransferase class IV [Flavobacterium aciduliphilum]RAR75846.1 branched-chain amino acid aminotransferase [Flavobacterium aciduliphilum]
MINFNGTLCNESTAIPSLNRGFLYGDAVFETLKLSRGNILFLEDHYFRLMASMRILRMKIPAYLTMEFMEAEILKLAQQLSLEHARVRWTVFRNEGGYYLPKDRTISYTIQVNPLEQATYVFNQAVHEVDLYKDFFVSKQLLSNIKTTNRIIQVIGSIYAEENGLQNALVLNEDKHVVEALNGNLFIRMGNTLITPPLSEGCLNGIMRKQVLKLAEKQEHIEVQEAIISPFDLQKADELFITNVIVGVQSVTKYRKKDFQTTLAQHIIAALNESI